MTSLAFPTSDSAPSTPSLSPTTCSPPPSSPASSDPSHDDDHLAESFLMVDDGDDSDQEVSTTGNDVFSDTSIDEHVFSDSSTDDHREQWDGSSDGEGSETGVDSPKPARRRFSITSADIDHLDGVIISSPHTSVGGSYVDAEATATDLTDSRGTISDGLKNSHIQLMMPDPGKSFLTCSDDTTPSASLDSLGQYAFPDVPGFGVHGVVKQKPKHGLIDKDWLEASSKLWRVSPDTSVISEKILLDGHMTEHEYMLLASHDDLPAKSPKETLPVREVKQLSRRQRLRAALASANLAGVRGVARNWSARISVIALASFLSLALYHSYIPSAPHVVPEKITPSVQAELPVGMTMWERLASSVQPSITEHHPPEVSTSTGVIPDLQLIKQALSTFSTASEKLPHKDSAVSEPSSDAPRDAPRKRKRESSVPTDSCCAVAIPSAEKALAVHTISAPDVEDYAWARALRRKISRQMHDRSTAAAPTPNVTCECGLSPHLALDIVASLLKTLGPAQQYAVTAWGALAAIYEPAMVELRKELGELLALSRAVAETATTLTQFMIRRTTRGVGISRRALETVSQRVKASMPQIPHPDARTIKHAREQIDQLSVFVEDQTTMIAEYIEEQASIIQDKSTESLRQAKRGLDKLIKEARKAVGEDKPERKEPMPRMIRRRELAMMNKMGRGRRRSHRGLGEVKGRAERGRKLPEPEQRTMAGRLWDLVHHGAVALVV